MLQSKQKTDRHCSNIFLQQKPGLQITISHKITLKTTKFLVTTYYTYCYWGLDIRSSYVVLDKMMGKLSSRQRKHYNASSLVATTHRNVDINFPRLFINTLIKVGGLTRVLLCPALMKKRLWKGSYSEIATIYIQSAHLKKVGRYSRSYFKTH